MSNVPPSCLNLSRLIEARLQAVSSRNIYSEHGFDARMRPDSGQVCHSLMVVSYCSPGSAQAQAAYATSSHNARADSVSDILLSVRRSRCHGLSCSTASRNSLVTRTELLEF